MFTPHSQQKLLPVVWLVLSILAMVIDYLSGPTVQFPILYIIPIGLAAWYSGPWWGGFLAIVLPFGRVIYWTVWQHTHEKISNVSVNTIIRITAFLLLVFLINQIIKKSKDVTDRIRTEQKLLEQQRQLRILSSKFTVAEETERRRIATGLHDDINQMLIAAKLKLNKLAGSANEQEVKAVSDDIDKYLDSILKASQSLIFDLVSPVLQKLGLEAALEDLCERMNTQHEIKFKFFGEGSSRILNNEIEIIIFHAVHELLRNVARHAEAKNADITFLKQNDILKVIVQDDGKGFLKDPQRNGLSDKGGFGIFAIEERIKSFGGSIKIEKAKPQGSRIELLVPLQEEENEYQNIAG
ncbi:MAG: histidine kinase [Kiritimatiellae bacterium]|nr:histidine kinase [Kiritimatiellia bacterium]MDD5521051.1 histidine kinase [Kiritimatiellia bacterium]